MPSYSIDDFRVTSPFNVLAPELAAQGKISTGNRFGRKLIPEILDYFSMLTLFSNISVGRDKFVSPFIF